MFDCEYNSLAAGIGLVCVALVAVFAFSGPVVGEQTEDFAQRVDRLIEQLGDADFHVRQQAQAELAALGSEAFEALTAAETHEDLEIATRAKYLLRLLQLDLARKNDPPKVKAILARYRLLSTKQQLAGQKQLAGLKNNAGVPALCRLVRFERLDAISKHAALAIIGREAPEETPSAELVRIVRQNLRNSNRTAAKWLLAYARFHDDRHAALGEWKKLVQQEQAALQRRDTATSPQIVSALLHHQIQWICILGNNQEEMAAAMRTLLGLKGGDTGLPAPQIEWLVERRAWKVLGQKPDQFAKQLSRDPRILLYKLAKIYLDGGKKKLADETVEKTLLLDPGNGNKQLLAHLRSGFMLQHEGLFKWAEREYRHVINTATPRGNHSTSAYSFLAEMLHDQGENLRAGEVLAEMLRTMGKEEIPAAVPDSLQNRLKHYRSRMNYFLACHWAAERDRARQQQYIQKALEVNPGDADVLIAAYLLAEPTAEYRKRVIELIQKLAEQTRQQIKKNPNFATPYNQFAWLIANTEGDFDEALKYSRHSLKLEPKNGGFYDTLGRCYYAKGDYENAVKYQAEAVRLKPHSGLIARQLELFKKALNEKKPKQQVQEPEVEEPAIEKPKAG